MKKTIAATVLILPLALSCNVYCRADSCSIGMNQAHAARMGNVMSTAARHKGMLAGMVSGAMGGAAMGAKLGSVIAPPWGTIAGVALGAIGGAVFGHVEDRQAIAAETAKKDADRALKEQITALMREQGMTQNAINTVYNELRNQQAKSREDILAAVNQSLAKADATQEQIAALSSKLCSKVEENQKQLLQATEEIKKGQQLMLGKMDAVEKRMDQEFKILGADLENKHAAQMAALSANLQAIKGVDAAVAKLNKDMFAEFARLGDQLNVINEKLDRIEAKIDVILMKVDASVKAYYRDGNDYLNRYYATHSVDDLRKALDGYIHFKNAYAPAEGELEEAKTLRSLTYYSMILCQMELVALGDNPQAGTKLAVDYFDEMARKAEDLSFINYAWLLFKQDDVDKQAVEQCAPLLVACYERHIANAFTGGDLNEARRLAADLETLVGKDNELSKATYAYISTGKDAHNRFKADVVLNAVSRCVKGEKNIRSDNLPRFAKNIVEGKGAPADFEELLTRFNNSDFVVFSIRMLLRAGYKDAAFEILKKRDTANDDFRVKAFLARYSEKDRKKFAAYKKLVLEDPTFSPATKAFAEKL